IIFEETRTKRLAEGDNITIDKRYNNDCWFFETTRYQWESLSLCKPFLLTTYNSDANLPKAVHLEESDVEIDIAIQLKADQETEDEAHREYARRQHKLQVAQGTAPALPSVPPKSQLDKFLETVVSQASSNEYILGTELTSQDVSGSETTEQQIMQTQPKPELATKLTRLKNPQWLLWKKRQHCRKQLQFRKQLQQ
uniref:Uncharacterized protein n=1 Tax=Romanomermis culicivorax TaxID=13658 RepID=A0A915I5F7_ROMCU